MNTDTNIPTIEAVNLTKRYEDGVLAVDNINFEVQAGEVFAMLGGNGAGKTTAINIFLNMLEPTKGEAKIKGIASHIEPLTVKKELAYVSENVMLYPNFSAMQNIDFFTKLGGRTDVSEDEYHAVLRRVGLPEQVHSKKLKSFSKGMRQKCGIAIAILKNASAILLDEPTSGLDPKAGFEFMNLLKELKEEGKAILMSTHDIFRAKEAASTIAIMDNGRMVMREAASNLFDKDLESIYMQYMAGHTTSLKV
ncbi:MAG: ABC transporter ATP-binding protein [Calditrichaeota bacterium]|nr:MAG: ABC transporter ATP-binding protein [Calditrichota bacterium]